MGPVTRSQDAVNRYMAANPVCSNAMLYDAFGLQYISDPGEAKRAQDILRKYRNRWKGNQINVTVQIPTVESRHNVREHSSTKKVTTWTSREVPLQEKRDKAGMVFQAIVDKKLVDIARVPGRTGIAERDAGTNLQSSDQPNPATGGKPRPTFRAWRGETWSRDPLTNKIIWTAPKKALPPEELSYHQWYLTFIDDKDKYNPYYKPGKAHEEVGGILESITYGDITQILAHRDFFKSTYVDEGFSLYNITEKWDTIGKKGVLVVTWDDGLAQRTYNNIVEHLMFNERIVSFYGYLVNDEVTQNAQNVKRKKKFTQTTCFFKYQPPAVAAGLRCTSFQSGGITGWHPGMAILDDMQDDLLSETLMAKFKRVLLKKLFPAMSKTGFIIITGTIKGWSSDNDVYLLLEKNDSVNTYRYPAVTRQDSSEPAFPDMADVKYHIDEVPVKNHLGRVMVDRFGHVKMRNVYVIDEIKNRELYHVTFNEKFTLDDVVIIRLKYRFGDVKDQCDDDFFAEFQLQASNPAGKVFKMNRVICKPPVLHNCRRFVNYADFCNFYTKETTKIPVYLFVDPGGKSSHGVAILIMAYVNGPAWGPPRFVILDAVVMRVGLVEVAIKIAKLIEKWHVSAWAVESNFDQAETYGATLAREFHLYCERTHVLSKYIAPLMFSNDEDKLTRINKEISSMIGHEEQEDSFYVNPDCEDFERLYNQELRGFGFSIKPGAKHEFDLLDCGASIKIHMLGCDTAAAHAVNLNYVPIELIGV